MHKINKTLEKGYKYTPPTFHYTHSFKRILKDRNKLKIIALKALALFGK